MRRVWAEIDLAAVRHNLALLRSYLKPGTRVMPVLKANAYGHGAADVARALIAEGIDAIGVGDSQEAVELRDSGVTLPIHILGTIVPGEIERVVRERIVANIHSLDMAEEMNEVAGELGVTAEVHLMLDTGMGRLGVDPLRAVTVLRALPRLAHVRLTGICTHLSSPGELNGAFTELQLRRFRNVVAIARQTGHRNLLLHAASHAAMLRYPESHFDMVRPGLALYGVCGLPNHAAAARLKRALTLKTQIAFLKDVPEGTPVGYSRLWYATAPTRIATLPIGYNDGFPIGLTGKAEVLIRGVRCPVVGRVSMDYIMVDAGRVSNPRLGDVVTLIGKDGDEEIRVEDIAAQLGTLPYEVSCRLGRRVQRVYQGATMSSWLTTPSGRTPPLGKGRRGAA